MTLDPPENSAVQEANPLPSFDEVRFSLTNMITAPTNSMQIGAKAANALSSVGFICTMDEIFVDSLITKGWQKL